MSNETLKETRELLVDVPNQTAAFIEASLADNGKPDPLDVFKGMPMVAAVKEGVVGVQEIHNELHGADVEAIRALGADAAAASHRLCKAVCALIEAVKPA